MDKKNNIQICKKCILPSTKPDIQFNKEGVCSGCENFEGRKKIDWKKKEKEFKELISKYKKNKDYYNCIIPCSGGKDSHFQTLKMLELGMNPLCVTASTCKLSELGRHNIENLRKLGVDLIEISTNPLIRRRLNKFGLETVGDISWPEHITIFTIPVRMSVQLKIPLLIWGECPQNENSGPMDSKDAIQLDRRWLEEFGGLLGLRASDLEDVLNLKKKDLVQFQYPSAEDLEKNGTFGVFLGQFFPWDGHENAQIAKKYGFATHTKNVEGSIIDYEDLDNVHMKIHHYFKFLKYGYDRVTEWSSWHIRRDRMTRKESLKINKNQSGKFPTTYLDYNLDEILKEIDCSKDEFIKICDKFTNKNLFKTNNKDELIKDSSGNLLLKDIYH